MKKNLFLFLILTSIFISQCGFKKVSQTDLNYSISQIETEGDKKINHRLKNELLIKNPKGKNLLVINLTTDKKQVVKEKNIRNEITKYQIIINANAKIKIIGKEKVEEFTVSTKGDYSIANQYSKTLDNEKNTIKKLVENLSKKILTEINYIVNDI